MSDKSYSEEFKNLKTLGITDPGGESIFFRRRNEGLHIYGLSTDLLITQAQVKQLVEWLKEMDR